MHATWNARSISSPPDLFLLPPRTNLLPGPAATTRVRQDGKQAGQTGDAGFWPSEHRKVPRGYLREVHGHASRRFGVWCERFDDFHRKGSEADGSRARGRCCCQSSTRVHRSRDTDQIHLHCTLRRGVRGDGGVPRHVSFKRRPDLESSLYPPIPKRWPRKGEIEKKL